MTERDAEKLLILAGWHFEQAKAIRAIKRRSSWTAEVARQLAAHHDDSFDFLSGLALAWRVKHQERETA